MTDEEKIAWYGYLGSDPNNRPAFDDPEVVVPDPDAARNIAFEALAG